MKQKFAAGQRWKKIENIQAKYIKLVQGLEKIKHQYLVLKEAKARKRT